jgi:hypothetical protein
MSALPSLSKTNGKGIADDSRRRLHNSRKFSPENIGGPRQLKNYRSRLAGKPRGFAGIRIYGIFCAGGLTEL